MKVIKKRLIKVFILSPPNNDTIIQQKNKFVYTFLNKYDKIWEIKREVRYMKIEKTTKIGELLEIAPEKAEILLNAGMHCLGCPASQEETIEEACMVHGIDVEEILNELNA